MASKRILSHVGSANYYEEYKSKSKNPLEKTAFTKMLADINQSIMDKIINEAYDFRVPFRVGYIFIKKQKINFSKSNLSPDWKATKELWAEDPQAKKDKTLLYHLNEHTDSYYARFHFSKYTSNIKNKTYYSFIPSRANKRAIAKKLKEHPEMDYYE